VVACVLALLFSACSAEPKEDLLEEAELLCLDQQWEKARPLLRRYLHQDPNNAAAHFYLGRCSLMADPEVYSYFVAEGEFQTALRIFRRNGRVNPIARFASADTFEYRCQLGSAKVYLNILDHAFGNNISVWQVQETVKRGIAYLDLAAEILPDDPELQDYQRAFNVLLLGQSD
jgi:tetratricopeptide (TPR) repeat protein